ncbi:MAG: glycosyltransferase family 2 protein [bacterium]|nr:glycosyltransferase family 2 protein [bacterium]
MNSTSPFVSIIIASYKGESVIAQCLTSLLESDYKNYQIIFVNNGCIDRTREIVAEQFPQVVIIDSPVNLGFAGGYNLGMKYAIDKSEILILLNDDVTVTPLWLTEYVQCFQRDTLVGIVGCKMLYPDKKTVQHAGGIMYPNGRTWHRGNGELDNGQWDTTDEPDYVTGASFAIRRELIERLGYLDEDYKPGYFEETELCFRAKKLGYKVVYLPSAVAYHYESYSTGKASSDFFEKYHRNRIRFVLKNYSIYQLYWALQEETKFRTSVKGTPEYAAILKAYRYNMIRLPNTLFARWKTKWQDYRMRCAMKKL